MFVFFESICLDVCEVHIERVEKGGPASGFLQVGDTHVVCLCSVLCVRVHVCFYIERLEMFLQMIKRLKRGRPHKNIYLHYSKHRQVCMYACIHIKAALVTFPCAGDQKAEARQTAGVRELRSR